MARAIPVCPILVALVASIGASSAPAGAEDVPGLVLDALQTARGRAGVPRLDRRPQLDAVALELAEEVARRPHDRRFSSTRAVGARLRQAGIGDFSRALEHLAVERGNADPATRFVSSWYGYDASWEAATSTDYEAIGLASVTAPDGWTVLAGILVQDERWSEPGPTPWDPGMPAHDLETLEREAVRAVNEIRVGLELEPLVVSANLAAVAREHSDAMSRRGFFGHFSPDGEGPRQRVERYGLSFRKLGENVQTSRGERDPVASAVDSWMNSPGHRRTMLTPEFEVTGVGVARSAEGGFYFTQLFMIPPNHDASR